MSAATLAWAANSAAASCSACRPARNQAKRVVATPHASATSATFLGRRYVFIRCLPGCHDRITAFPRIPSPVSLIVQKYGGTSMGSPERIREVARRVAHFAAQGHQLVIVPSAMAGETNRLISLAKELNPDPHPRELDVIASTGEQVSIGLLSLALQNLGLKAKSYTGWQVPILTDAAYSKARILAIEERNIREDLDAGYVVIVAGFQGIDDDNNITTL